MKSTKNETLKKVMAGNTTERQQVTERAIKIIERRIVPVNGTDTVIYIADELTTGHYLSGKYRNRKGDTKKLKINLIEESYVIADVNDPLVGPVRDAIIMSRKLAKKEAICSIVATYCYYLSNPDEVAEDIKFRFIDNNFVDMSGLGENLGVLELDRESNETTQLMAYLQTGRLYGSKFLGLGFGCFRIGGVYAKISKDAFEKAYKKATKDALKDKRVDKALDKASDKALAKAAKAEKAASAALEIVDERAEVESGDGVSAPVEHPNDKGAKAVKKKQRHEPEHVEGEVVPTATATA